MSLASAIATRDASELPSRRDEDWRWTDLRGLIRQVPPQSPAVEDAVQRGGPFAGLSADELVIANGRHNWWPEKNSRSVHYFEHAAPDAPLAADCLPMAVMAARDANEPRASILTFKADGAALLRFVSDAHTTAHHARVGVVVEAGVKAVLLESYEGQGEDYLANYLLEVFLEDGAELERVVVAAEAAEAVLVTTADVRLSPGARFLQTTLTSGARRQRLETRVRHPGGHAQLRLDGVYLLRGKRHADLTTVVDHQGLDGATDQLTKGVVRDQARGVFQGRIVVAEGADKTEARMGHHALILSDQAEVDAKPELEIYADDVACAHGNTVGALDEEALFYIRQRGIPEPEARALLTEAFVGEVIDRIGHEGARDAARAWVGENLKEAS
jgi:Fe-S cluster assembly protein SufD